MFDVDAFVADCLAANAEAQPRLAIKEVVERAVSRPEEVAAALPPERAELTKIYVSPELTILKLVWSPGMRLWPHDHRMWAAIGIYTGGEDNDFYRRAEHGLIESGARQLRPKDTVLLGDDAIHAVTNPTQQFTGAIHVYGGQFFTTARSEWDEETGDERPWSSDRTLAYFEEQNAKFAASG